MRHFVFEFLKKGSIVLKEHIQAIVISSTHFSLFFYLTARHIDFVDLYISILKEKAKFVEVLKEHFLDFILKRKEHLFGLVSSFEKKA